MEMYAYQQEALYVYGGLALAAFLVSWWIVRRWWPFLRITILSLVGALAFTPAFVIPDKDYVAPAAVYLVFDAAQHTHDGQLQAVATKDATPILVVWGGLFVLGWLLHWLLPKSRADVDREFDRNAFDKRLARETGEEPEADPHAAGRKPKLSRKEESARQDADQRVRERIEPDFRTPNVRKARPQATSTGPRQTRPR